MREQPEQTYYPAAKVRLIVRFDEFGADDTPEPPRLPPHLRTGKENSGRLTVSRRDGALVLLGEGDGGGSGATGSPQKRTRSADNRTHSIEGVIPQTLTINRNGIRTADTMNVTIRFADMPIDPRAVRACAIEAYVGTLDPEDFARGVTGTGTTEPSAPLRVLPDEFTDPYGVRRSNLRFSGWVDSWEVDFGDNDEPVVILECTDNTRLLIEQDAPPKLTVSAAKPIDEAIADYLAQFPQFRGFEVEYRPAGSTPPKLESALGKTAYKPKLGPAAGGGGKLTVWDYLTDVCGAVGHIVRLDGVRVVIQRARTLYGEKFSGRPDDPFVGRVLPSGREIKRRLYIYGRNIKKPTYRRNFARFAPINVEVRGYDPKQKKTLVARFPTKKDRQKRMLPGDGGADQAWRVFPVRGVTDEATLRAIAQGIYESVGRNELESNFETRSLASYGGDNSDPDTLDCMPGDAIDVEIARDDEERETIGTVEEQIARRPASFLKELGFDDDFASAYARAISNVGLTTTFRVKQMTIDFSLEDGISVSMNCVNYVEVRSDKELPAGEEPERSNDEPEPRKVVVSEP